MKFSKKIITDATVVLGGLAIGVTMSGCAGLNGANGDVCNSGNTNCVSFSVHPGSAGAPSGSPASASTYPTPTPQSESASASIPGVTESPTATFTPTLTPPPTPTEAVATSSPIPQAQFDSSLHRCKQSSGVNTLVSFSLLSNQQPANDLFTCMQIPPDQMNLLIKLLVIAVYDALTHQPFNPGQYQGTTPAQQAQDVVTAYQGS